ncbi:hypothetical protein PV05_07303 [Exophiala xenobiotica]|uniref:Peptidase M6-like domain-containing protein n=1 Tax=Exophiala xenobiotica TaxID=348802 RepID=A0A0D2EHW4_9EURO|nr:uncharacterized protein PV05_07303 [Exophiala xenobiotica]KIW54983.1 hypothetical protein PV05_07303 [Exophiala xenobiotica]
MCLGSNDHPDGPCLVPPHPMLRAHLAEDRLKGQPQQALGQIVLSGPTGTFHGLNDGTIFPRSQFQQIPVPSLARMRRAALERTPLRGPIRVAIVLVDFSDKPMTMSKQHFEELFFSKGKIPTGSVTEYYEDVSGGKVELTGEVVGPFRMPLKLAQYAHGASGLTEAEPNLQDLAAHALASADGSIDLTPYDNDHNGVVDAFIVVHAGKGAEEIPDRVERASNIWSAKWILRNNTQADGTRVFGFLTVPEFAKIGVCAHELGHLLFGWPDLYDIDQDGDEENIGVRSAGVGDWCLMSGGSWGHLEGNEAGTTPCHPSAWCKANQGWINLIPDQQNRSIALKDVKKEPREVHRLWTNGNIVSQEYFLIENRQLDGFDRSLPGQGLLIWHIDDAKETNRDENHYKVGLVQSDNRRNLEAAENGAAGNRGDAGDPYPGTSNNSSFGAFTNPNSRTYRGRDSFVSIRNISAPSQTMTMDIAVRAGLPPTQASKL